MKKNAYQAIKLQTKFCFSIWTTRNQQSAQEYKNYFRQFHLLDGNKDVFTDEIEVGWNRWHTSVSENFPPDQASDRVSWVIFYMSFQAFLFRNQGIRRLLFIRKKGVRQLLKWFAFRKLGTNELGRIQKSFLSSKPAVLDTVADLACRFHQGFIFCRIPSCVRKMIKRHF